MGIRARAKFRARLGCRGEGGFSAIFILALFPAFVLIAGLVFDGGNAMATKRRAVDEAQSAARAGAEAMSTADLHQGGVVLDAPAAVAASEALLAGAGLTGEVGVSGDVVTVTVHSHYSSALLATDFDVVGTGSARSVRGVSGVSSGA